jgi:RNA polymerase sigma-70 factor, ECF subfamily
LQKVLLGGAWFVLQQKELSPYAQWRSCDERTRGRRRPSWAPTGIASTAWPFGSRNASDAEEVAQDALRAASRKVDTFRATSAFGSWVYRITANAAYQKLRKTGSQRHEVSWEDLVPSLDDFGQHGEVAIDWSRRLKDPAVEGELKRVLGRAIDELPAHYRTASLLHDVDGLSNPEIAQTLQVKLAAIKSRVHLDVATTQSHQHYMQVHIHACHVCSTRESDGLRRTSQEAGEARDRAGRAAQRDD